MTSAAAVLHRKKSKAAHSEYSTSALIIYRVQAHRVLRLRQLYRLPRARHLSTLPYLSWSTPASLTGICGGTRGCPLCPLPLPSPSPVFCQGRSRICLSDRHHTIYRCPSTDTTTVMADRGETVSRDDHNRQTFLTDLSSLIDERPLHQVPKPCRQDSDTCDSHDISGLHHRQC